MTKHPLPERLAELDGIRGLACLTVILFHLSISGFLPPISSSLPTIGITLFFSLSGFLLATLYGGQAGVKKSAAFIITRLFRIYPLYILMTVIAYYLASHYGYSIFYNPPVFRDFDFSYLIAQLTLQNGMGRFWTIIIEMRYYLLFALFLCITPRNHKIRLPLLLMGVLYFATIPLPDSAHFMVMHGDNLALTLGFLKLFLPGALLGILYRQYAHTFGAAARNAAYLFSMLITLGLVALLCVPALLYSIPTIGWGNVFGVAVLSGLYIFATAIAQAKHGNIVFTNPVSVYIGKISYSLYLVHGVPIMLCSKIFGLPPVPGLIISVASTFVLSVATYHYIEKPGINTGKRLVQKFRL